MSSSTIEKYTTYFESFFEDNENLKDKEGYISLFNKLGEYDKFITEWDSSDLDNYIKSLDSISTATIVKYQSYIKNFYKYVCDKENKKAKPLFLTRGHKFYLNYEKLFSLVLSEQDYTTLKNCIFEVVDGVEYNTRDKLLVELPWELGLTSEEIRNLKETDVIFKIENNQKVAVLNLINRVVKTYNIEIMEDIEKTINQTKYFIPSRESGKPQFRDLKDTEYIIRAVQGKLGVSNKIYNPSLTLRNALKRVYILPNVDLEALSLEDIRRSKVIHMFKNNASIEDVAEFLGKKNTCDLYWLKELAIKVKKIENKK